MPKLTVVSLALLWLAGSAEASLYRSVHHPKVYPFLNRTGLGTVVVDGRVVGVTAPCAFVRPMLWDLPFERDVLTIAFAGASFENEYGFSPGPERLYGVDYEHGPVYHDPTSQEVIRIDKDSLSFRYCTGKKPDPAYRPCAQKVYDTVKSLLLTPKLARITKEAFSGGQVTRTTTVTCTFE